MKTRQKQITEFYRDIHKDTHVDAIKLLLKDKVRSVREQKISLYSSECAIEALREIVKERG